MPPRRLMLLLALSVLSLLMEAVLLVGCDRTGSSTPTDRPHPTPRIVSLSPALSRTLVDLGLSQWIAGRSSFCDFLDPDIPAVGDLHNVDYERLVEIDPTHVFVQARTVDAPLDDLARERGWEVVHFAVLDTIDDIETVVREIPGRLYPPGSPERAHLAGCAAVMLNEIARALSPGGAPTWRGRTLLVFADDPVRCFGRGTYLHEVLVRVGGVNALATDGYPQLSLEDVTRLDPQAIIVIRESRTPGVDAAEAAGALATLEIGAVRNERIAVLAHPDAWRPCTGLVEVAAEMRDVLAGFADETDVADRVDMPDPGRSGEPGP